MNQKKTMQRHTSTFRVTAEGGKGDPGEKIRFDFVPALIVFFTHYQKKTLLIAKNEKKKIIRSLGFLLQAKRLLQS